MNKKVVVLGGGTGLSSLLRGLKQYPVDITAVVSVCDDGSSTGRLREEFNTPAVGDIRKVIVSLSETEPLVEELLNYRFKTTSDLNGHAVGNLLLTAMANITGNMSDGIESLSKVLNLKGKVLPLTEDNVVLMAKMHDGTIVEGEHHITEAHSKIKEVYYKHKPIVCDAVIKAIREADCIILSMGSLFTSILPNLICKDVIKEIDKSKAKIVYVCNIMTQPGETDNFKVSNHVSLLNKYLGKRKIDVVIANNGQIDKNVIEKYASLEQKDQVELDKEELKKMKVKVIKDDLISIENEQIRHDTLKLAFYIYATLIKN
ncbi:MAG: YvcK family protein [Bacilli bacterium]|nr:YvcK family protein [Bacilli bacterium]